MSNLDEPMFAISPLDGRYARSMDPLRDVASDFALTRNRVIVEIDWFILLSQEPKIVELPQFEAETYEYLRDITQHFSIDDYKYIKDIEATTVHDVKAVEYFVKHKLSLCDETKPYLEFVHFCCTSEDINSVAYAIMLKNCIDVIDNEMVALTACFQYKAELLKGAAMLSHTHGQPASPTTMGKEMAVFADRLLRARVDLTSIEVRAKMSGAVGNFNAHVATYPDVDWPILGFRLMQKYGFRPNLMTTQIEPHDYMADIFHTLSRFNNILLDASCDMWAYISIGYFGQKIVDDEVGSSTMPHKVNPINFENAEGNLGMANAVLEHMASKLQRSRLQRDLSDSTVLRNVGVGFGYSLLAYQAFHRGMDRVEADVKKMYNELTAAPEVLGEAIQMIMRRYGVADSYEQLKKLTRSDQFVFGEAIDRNIALHRFIAELDICDEGRKQLEALSPTTYIGLAADLARQ